MPYGPARAGHNGNIALFNSLHHNGGSFGRKEALTENPRDRLLKVMDMIDTTTLELADQKIFHGIESSKPWLLTEREMRLLEKLQATKN